MPMNKVLKKTGDSLREAAADLLPPMRVELLSDRQAVVDGCRGILEYNECCIRLCTGAVTVRFTGEGLQMRNFGSLGAVVEGRIRSVEFVGPGPGTRQRDGPQGVSAQPKRPAGRMDRLAGTGGEALRTMQGSQRSKGGRKRCCCGR